MNKRKFLAASLGAGAALSSVRKAFAQEDAASHGRVESAVSPTTRRASSRIAKTTKLFKSPDGFPNAIAVTEEGLWIGEQKESGQGAASYHLPEPNELTEHAWLVDWKGKF